jgi:hypothetical protein
MSGSFHNEMKANDAFSLALRNKTKQVDGPIRMRKL